MTNAFEMIKLYDEDEVSCTTIEDTAKQAKALVKAASAAEYLSYDTEELAKAVKTVLSSLDEKGYLCILKDPRMPSDTYVDFVCKPTYAAAALLIYTYCYHKELLGEEGNAKLALILKACLGRRLFDHGYDAAAGQLENLLVLVKGGLAEYLKQPLEEAAEFNRFAKGLMAKMRHDYLETVKKDELFYARGFGPVERTKALLEILTEANKLHSLVFVYGTLMKGERANRMLRKGLYAGKASLADYACMNLGSYPGIVKSPGSTTEGELWYVSSDMLDLLDEYEGKGKLYDYVELEAQALWGKEIAGAYVYLGAAGDQVVKGRWTGAEKH